MSNRAFYMDEDDGDGYYAVVFLVLDENKKLIRRFNDSYKARLFVNKLKRSKKCRVLSCPIIE